MLTIAAIHAFRVGSYLEGDAYLLYYSYFSDFILPFGAYFLLWMNDLSYPFLRHWAVKAALAFAAPAFSETMQAFGVYFLGVTFDPLDYAMYALGALTAALLDKQLLERLLPSVSAVEQAQ